MRKIFGTATGLALIGASLFGAVYAWPASSSTGGTATVGTAGFAINLSNTSNLVGPDNGSPVTVATGTIDNTGDFTLDLTGGSVVVTSDPPGSCAAGHFNNDPDTDVASVVGTGILAGALGAGGFDVNIATEVGAPTDCQGASLSYTVTIDAVTS